MIGLQIRVARKIEEKGPFYHGTKAGLSIGDILLPGYGSNYGKGEGKGRIYIVEPTGEIEDDHNLDDKKIPDNPTRSYRTREPLHIVGEVSEWIGHTREELQNMRRSVEKIKYMGIEVIND